MDIDAAFSLGEGVLQVGTMDEDVGGSSSGLMKP
jgi:hypothetical protein